ncbi:MAG TPA: signal recognition particle-docking protein FtsY [Pedomonas sp.]|uniref:signal recognition particle-docking protein FtsY n=1 Tax=Pedomonas sp. TaxID=2976421 RepID=UPI002F424EFD
MSEETTENSGEKKGWFGRLKQGLSRSAEKLTGGITGLFTKAKLDAETLEDLEEWLISSDLGVATSAEVCERLKRDRYEKDISPEEVRQVLADTVVETIAPVAKALEINRSLKPHVVLVVGVNGSGKTTTIAKLASLYQEQGLKVMLAAGDTFRAAAVEQLQVWGDRIKAPVITTKVGGDSAGLAFSALEKAKAEGYDLLLIDTAGRLQNKSHLMDELAKIRRVIGKLDADAPHDTLLVLDATTGQNALNQIEVFRDVAGVTGLVMTKLDGTARGGVLVAAAEKFKLPIHAIGVGEKIGDLRPFEPRSFARALVGLEG